MSYSKKDNSFDTPKKHWAPEEAKLKIASYCAYQERCQKEVREKLAEKGVYEDFAEELIAFLITEGYLNEERYAKAFVRGKFRLKKWGRRKILYELRNKELSDYLLKKGFEEIEEEEYWEVLVELVEKKSRELKIKDPFQKRDKIFKFLYAKGFETDLIQEAITSLKFNQL
jgi:regulatory protein